MSRIILQDIKLNKKKNISPKIEEVFLNVEKIEKKEVIKENIKDSKIESYFKNQPPQAHRLQRFPHVKNRSNGFNKYVLLFLILSFIVGLIYWGGIFFQKADIIVTAKHQLITYKDKQFVALKESNGNTDDIMIMIYTDQKSKKVILTEPKEVSVKAKGSIVLYNEFSTTPQKILSGSFISDNEGKTYKTENVINIPGFKKDNNEIIPGEVSVDISAFLAGDTYNGSPTDFYISAFKGTSKYNKIYGKLKSPFTGGASGLVYTPTDKDINQINNLAETSFKSDLLKKVQATIYPGYILYPNASTFSYKIENGIFSKTPETEVIINGTLSVVLLKEKNLIDNIIKISLPKITGDELKEIKISDLNNLTFNFTNKEQLISKEMDSVSFNLSGDIDVVWNPDLELLKTKLIGVDKVNVLTVFKQDPGIESAVVKLFPRWFKYIPKEISKINIVLK